MAVRESVLSSPFLTDRCSDTRTTPLTDTMCSSFSRKPWADGVRRQLHSPTCNSSRLRVRQTAVSPLQTVMDLGLCKGSASCWQKDWCQAEGTFQCHFKLFTKCTHRPLYFQQGWPKLHTGNSVCRPLAETLMSEALLPRNSIFCLQP